MKNALLSLKHFSIVLLKRSAHKVIWLEEMSHTTADRRERTKFTIFSL